MDYVEQILFEHKDEKFADFQAKLIPNIPRESIIGVRTPELRQVAKRLMADEGFRRDMLDGFLNQMPHRYFDENVLHGELISLEKNFLKAMALTEDFLPFVDNWAVCDMLSPKSFGKHKDELYIKICEWLQSERVYTVRFGISMMIKYFLDGDFKICHLAEVRDARGDDYYIKMVKAWYFATALAKHYCETFDFLKNGGMDEWVLKKSIQKARESFRVSDEHKAQIKTLI